MSLRTIRRMFQGTAGSRQLSASFRSASILSKTDSAHSQSAVVTPAWRANSVRIASAAAQSGLTPLVGEFIEVGAGGG